MGAEALTPTSMQTLAPAALRSLLASPQWKLFVQKTREEVSRASLLAAENIQRDRHESPASNPSLGDSLGSTWNQSNFIFMQG